MSAYSFSNDLGLTLTVTQQDFDSDKNQIIFGGNDLNPTWEEYLDDYSDEYKPHIELIKKAITELGWIGDTAEQRANDWNFVFSDGIMVGFSWRAWGDLMQAIVNKREGYMTYYM